MSDHSIGTVVEIAVAEMFEADESAVEDLTKWLIQTAEDTPDKNSKGLLLNLGGKVSSYRDGGNDHSPLFRAKAEFGGIVTKGEGKSKKKAEQDAAGKLLLEWSSKKSSSTSSSAVSESKRKTSSE